MKKIFLEVKRGWYLVFSIMCVFVIVAIIFVVCNHNKSDSISVDNGIEYLIPENAEVIVDMAGIFRIPGSDEIITTFDGDFAVGIGISARFFYLPKDIQQYQNYYDLITATREPNILKLTIGNRTHKGNPILKVELPDEESEEYLEAKKWREYLSQPEEIEYLIPEDAEVIISSSWIMKTSEGKEERTVDGDSLVALTDSARPFYLPRDILHYQEYYDLITAKREPNILKFTIGNHTDEGFPILKVELPEEGTIP